LFFMAKGCHPTAEPIKAQQHRAYTRVANEFEIVSKDAADSPRGVAG
jgi:hypothetical protein